MYTAWLVRQKVLLHTIFNASSVSRHGLHGNNVSMATALASDAVCHADAARLAQAASRLFIRQVR